MTPIEIVKNWNSKKGTSFKTVQNGQPSYLISKIKRVFDVLGEADADRYYEAMMLEPNYNIWDYLNPYSAKTWLEKNPKASADLEPAVVSEAKPAEPAPQGSLLSALGNEIVALIGKDLAEKVVAEAQRKFDEYLTDKTIVKVVEYDGKRNKIDEVTHEVFEKVLQFVAMDEPVFLTGPAGSGKNVICEQVAKALGMNFYFTNAVTQEYKLTGYGDAMGNFVKTQFYDWCVNGGLFMFDEMDASIPEALIVVNCALANRYFDFPVKGRVKLNDNCRIIACGNTWGTGASLEYVGRNQLDGATLNRFAFVEVEYDGRIEEAVAGGNADVLALCREFRKACVKNGCHAIVSYREIGRLHKMIDVAKMDVAFAIKSCLVKGIEKDSLRMIASSLPYSLGYRKYVEQILNS